MIKLAPFESCTGCTACMRIAVLTMQLLWQKMPKVLSFHT